ncbi:hypothetical protein YPPY66_2550, partial [Yersinia pestis PY-66]
MYFYLLDRNITCYL